MLTITALKIIIDLTLAGSVLFMVSKAFRSPTRKIDTQALKELETSLIRLLKEADRSGAELEASLAKKQKQLEELLFDIETVEHRVNKGVTEADELRKSLRRLVADRLPEEVSASATIPSNTADVNQKVSSNRKAEVSPIVPPARQEPIERRNPQESYNEPQLQHRPYQGLSELSASTNNKSALRSQIEKEVYTNKVEEQPEVIIHSQKAVQRSLEDVYAHCEELIRAGHSIAEISRLTQMAPKDVETLKGILLVEDEDNKEGDQSIVENDSRLGVLSAKTRSNPIGRSTQLL